MPDAINKTPETRGRIEIKIYPLTIILAYPFIGKFDPFGYSDERKTERKLIKDYEIRILDIIQKLKKENYETACRIAKIPEKIRGFGHIKKNNLNIAKSLEANLVAKL